MQSNYMYYPRPVQQSVNKPEYYYQGYGVVEEKTCSYKFLKAFSHLPCLPSSWSRSTRGAIGFSIFLFFILAIIVALGLIPVYIDLESFNAKNEFSIDVTNGLKLQNQGLFDILSETVDSNRTLEQNITLTNEINSLTTQLNTKFRSLNTNFEKVYNVRLTPNADQSVDVSYTIKTNPVKKSVIQNIKDNIDTVVKNPLNFNQMSLTNSTVSLNQQTSNIKISEPILGEFPSKSSILLSNSKTNPLQGDLLSGDKGPKSKKAKAHEASEEQKQIQSKTKIKFLKDDDYYIKKYPIYFPNYEPAYPPPSYQPEYEQPYTQPYNNPEYNEGKYTQPYVPESYPTTYALPPPEYKPEAHPVPPPKEHKPEHKPGPHKLKEEKIESTKLKNEEDKKLNLNSGKTSTSKNLKAEKSSKEKSSLEKSNKDVKLKLDDKELEELELSEESIEEVVTKKSETKKESKKKEKKKKSESKKSKDIKIKLKSNKEEVKEDKKVEKVEIPTSSNATSQAKEVKLESKHDVKVEEKPKVDIKEIKAKDEKEINVDKQEVKGSESVVEKDSTKTSTKGEKKANQVEKKIK